MKCGSLMKVMKKSPVSESEKKYCAYWVLHGLVKISSPAVKTSCFSSVISFFAWKQFDFFIYTYYIKRCIVNLLNDTLFRIYDNLTGVGIWQKKDLKLFMFFVFY
jgi:hypothetical protein